MYLSKRAKLITPPEELLNRIFNWAKGVYARKSAEFYENNNMPEFKEQALKYATNEPEKMSFKTNSPLYEEITVHIVPVNSNWRKRGTWDNKTGTLILYAKPPIYPKLMDQITFDIFLNQLKDTISHELIHFLQYSYPNFGLPPKKYKPKHISPEGKDVNTGKYYEDLYVYEQYVPHALRDIEFYPRLLSDARKIRRSLALMPPSQRKKAFRVFINITKPFIVQLLDQRNFIVEPFETFKTLKPKTKKYQIAVKSIYDFIKDLL